MALLGSPSALLKMMRARLLNAAGNERLRAKDNNCARSLSLSTNSAFGLPFSSRYLRSQDTAAACKTNTS